MCSMINVFMLTTILATSVQSARILAVIPTASYSHQIAFRPLWRELCRRGHELVLLTTDPMNDPSLTNLKEISFHDVYPHWNITKVTEKHKYNPFMVLAEMVRVIEKVISLELQHPQVQEMLKDDNEHFDLLMVEYQLPTMWAFSWKYKCPYVGITSLDTNTFGHESLGNPTNPALYTDYQLPVIVPLNFWERLFSVVFKLLSTGYINYALARANNRARQYFGEDLPPLEELAKNVSMVFINTNPAFHNLRPLGPNTISIGSFNHIESPQELPKDLQEFLDAATDGAIYFSLGTNVRSDSIDPKLLNSILGMFKTIPNRILWKFDANTTAGLPDNVKMISWGPQQDILRHKNIKLFVMQAGLQSVEESIYYHVPILAIPFFGDQHGNAKIIERKGLGLCLNRRTLTESDLVEAALEILQNPKYKENVMEIAELMADQPMTGLEKAVWWTEYVLRHKGADHLKNPARHMPLYQFLLLDVIAFLIVVVFLVLFVLYRIFGYVVRRLSRLCNLKLKTL